MSTWWLEGTKGGHSGHPDGYGPEGIRPSSPDTGGSHGGVGIDWDGPGPAGEVYGSVYLPHQAGGGGSRDEDGSGTGTRGGGVAILEAGALVVDGHVLAHGGTSTFNSSRPPGAGGSIQVHAGVLRGGGRIGASGSSSGTNFTTGSKVRDERRRSDRYLGRCTGRIRSAGRAAVVRRQARQRSRLRRAGHHAGQDRE